MPGDDATTGVREDGSTRRAGGTALGPAPRPSPVTVGVGGAMVTGLLAAASLGGRPALAAGLLVVQVLVVLAWLALVDAPASGGAFVVAALAAVAADGVLLGSAEGGIAGLPAVVGLALLGAIVHQLARRRRRRVTEALAATTTAVFLAVSTAALLALQDEGDGATAVRVSLVAAAAAAVLGRLVDTAVPEPALADGASRGWPGLVAGLLAGTAAGAAAAVQAGDDAFTTVNAALFGLAVAATVSASDLAVDLGATSLRSGTRDARRVSALTPAGVLLPVATLGPVAYVAGRLLLG